MVSLRVSHVVSLCFLSWCLTFHNLCFSCAKTSTLSHLRLQGRQQTRLLQQNEEKCEKQISMASYSCFDSWPYKKPIKGWEWMMRDLVLSLAHSIMSFYGSWALLRWLPSPLLLFGAGVQCPWRDWYLAVKTTRFSTAKLDLMGGSKNRGTPKSSILIGVFHYKPSILGYPYFWKHPSDVDDIDWCERSLTIRVCYIYDRSTNQNSFDGKAWKTNLCNLEPSSRTPTSPDKWRHLRA